MYIKGLKGTATQPIVFTSEPGNARKAVISHDNYNIARIISSDNLVFDSLVFDGNGKTIWGVVFGQSFIGDKDIGDNKNMKFISNEIKNNDKEATLKVRRTNGVVVHNNYLHDGTNPRYGAVDGGYGEGMYFGCGSCPASQNTTSNVTVTNNKVQDIGGEGIEFKPGVRNIVASDNLVLDVGYNQRYTKETNFASCCYGAGIVVHPVSNTNFDTNAIVERNRVGRTTAHGIFAGAGNTEVNNNLLWQTGANHRLGLQNTVAREPFATSNWHNGTFDAISFSSNHTFGHTTSVLKDDNNYGNKNAVNKKASIVKTEITKHNNEAAAFSAWLESSF